MREIRKYPISPDQFALEMPEGAQPLSVCMQETHPYVWVLVDPEARKVRHLFVTINSRKAIPDAIDDLGFVGSFLSPSEKIDFHVFYAGEEEEEPVGT